MKVRTYVVTAFLPAVVTPSGDQIDIPATFLFKDKLIAACGSDGCYRRALTQTEVLNTGDDIERVEFIVHELTGNAP